MQNSSDERIIRIGCAAGFWGDTNTAAFQLVKHAPIQYLVFDYLAEITMSLLAKARDKNPEEGYATDFVTRVMAPLLPEIARKGIKVVSNAGGVNPLSCARALEQIINAAGLSLKVAVVDGDDLLDRATELKQHGIVEMFDGRPLPDQLTSINAYLGAQPVRAALAAGADIVVTGRIVDSALVLGPLMHEFGWSDQDYDLLAQGSLAGHLIECGAQCTGGNFTDWESVPGYENMGFPVAECFADGRVIITKPEKTGGLVSTATVAEQLVYEIGDPAAYMLPDVICNFTQVQLTQIAENRVLVEGARGLPPSLTYKVCATYLDGYRVSASFMLGGQDARRKGERVAQAILSKVQHVMGQRGAPPFSETCVEILGSEWTYGEHGRMQDSREVVVRLTARHFIKETLMFLASEIAQAATGMAPGITGIVGGRPKVAPVIRLYSFLLNKSEVQAQIHVNGHTETVSQQAGQARSEVKPVPQGEAAQVLPANSTQVALVRLAWARSGDKGNHSNIGVIARRPEYLPWLRRALTPEQVAAYFSHVLDTENGRVTRYELPGLHALNFLLENALGGGGMASLRADPQGKAFAQQLLDMPIDLPTDLLQEHA